MMTLISDTGTPRNQCPFKLLPRTVPAVRHGSVEDGGSSSSPEAGYRSAVEPVHAHFLDSEA